MGAIPLEKAFAAVRRGEFAPVYHLTGVEEVLKDEFVRAVTDAALEPAARDFNLDVRAASDLDGEALHALVETPPMLAERRVVVVRGIDQWRKNAKVWDVLERYVTRPSPSTILVLTSAGDDAPNARIAEGATQVAADGLKPEHLTRWLQRRAAALGVRLEPDAADHLVAAVGGNLGSLSVELEKLAAATPDETIAAADVARLVGVRRGETMFDWVDAVLVRDTGRAVELLDVVLAQAGTGGVQLVMTLGTALVGTRMARALVDRGTSRTRLAGEVFNRLRAARPLKLRSWKLEADGWAAAALRWSGDELDAALEAALDADRQLKSTTLSDERGILMSMLLRLPLARAAA